MATYLIPKGDHFSSLIPTIPGIATSPGLHTGKTILSGTVKFKKSCFYDLSSQPLCVNDTNKVIGFGYGLWFNSHQLWSIRLGWRINTNGKLILLLYAYVNGKRIEKRIGFANSFQLETEYPFEIINDRFIKSAIVKVADMEAIIPFDKQPSAGYILKPYFGGDCPAPQDMHIELTYN